MKGVYCSIVLATAFLCLSNAGAEDREVIATRSGEPGAKLTIAVEPGSGWLHTMKIGGIVPLTNRPQIAVWVEDGGGSHLATLYVTRWTPARDRRTGSIKVRRPESLPLWTHTWGMGKNEGSGKTLPDAVTAPTPKGSFTLLTVLPSVAGPVTVYVEVNHSLDFNDRFPKGAKTRASGQPGAVYTATVDTGAKGRTVEFKLAGHSSPDGSDGSLSADTSSLTTAKTIVSHITATVE